MDCVAVLGDVALDVEPPALIDAGIGAHVLFCFIMKNEVFLQNK
jgi:hypothetical protein